MADLASGDTRVIYVTDQSIVEWYRTHTGTETGPPGLSTSAPTSSTTSSPYACNRLGYFECGGEYPGCCPVGYICGAEDRCIFPDHSMKIDYVGRCPGKDGYGACDDDVGGGCCPPLYACLNGGCMLTQKLQKSLSTFEVTFDTESTTRVSSYTESMYPTSVDVFLNRLQTSPTRPISPASDTPVIGQVHVIRGLNDAAIAGIIVSSIVAVLMLLLGLYFFIRRQRNKRARNQQDSSHHKPTDDSLLELAEKSDVHEADAERHKAELPSNRNEAWELEDTSYTPELCPSHGLSEMEVHSGIPTKMEVGADTLKEARELPLVARTPISPSGTVETAQNPAQTPTPVSPLDKPNTTKSTPQNTLTISPIDTPGTTQKPPQF